MGTDRSPLDPDELVERIGAVASEVASVAVGLGILGINRVQAVRRDLVARLSDLADTGSSGSTDPAARTDRSDLGE
jgi:hypothetical protein